jgi:hypothetical protein
MTIRLRCAVPFCNRTAKGDGDPDQEMICRTHIRGVSKRKKALHNEASRRATKIMDKYPEPDLCPEIEVKQALAYIAVAKRLWESIKVEAIERAGGLR